MANYTCNLNQILRNSACFGDNCMSKTDRKAIDIYLKIKNLQASGGTNYSSNLSGLMKDSRLWQLRSSDTLERVDLWIDMQNAVFNGAVINQNANALATAAKCIRGACLGPDQMRGVSAFLKCALNTLDQPD